MTKPFDHTLKVLMETWPADWLRLVGLPADGSIESLHTELPTMAVQPDRLFRVSGPPAFVAHLELQSTGDEGLPDRVVLYNILTHRREQIPIVSSVLLLRPLADGRFMTGTVERVDPTGRSSLRFEYNVIRLWEIPVETILAGGPGVWPLAPLCRGAEVQFAEVLESLKTRMEQAPAERQRELWTATYVLSGLLRRPEVGDAILRGVQTMKESTTYQKIIAEGEAKGRVEGRVETLQEVILELGARAYGPPPQAIQAEVRRIRGYNRLHNLLLKVGEAAGWPELIAGAEKPAS